MDNEASAFLVEKISMFVLKQWFSGDNNKDMEEKPEGTSENITGGPNTLIITINMDGLTFPVKTWRLPG